MHLQEILNFFWKNSGEIRFESRLICLIFGSIAWSEIILAHVQGQNGVWHDRHELMCLSGDVVRLDLSTTLYINKHQSTAHASH